MTCPDITMLFCWYSRTIAHYEGAMRYVEPPIRKGDQILHPGRTIIATAVTEQTGRCHHSADEVYVGCTLAQYFAGAVPPTHKPAVSATWRAQSGCSDPGEGERLWQIHAHTLPWSTTASYAGRQTHGHSPP